MRQNNSTKLVYCALFLISILLSACGGGSTSVGGGGINSYSVGGTASGLVGSVVLQDNNGDNLTVTSNGSFQFATAVVYGNPYSVTVLTQPSGQTCVSSGSGTVSGNVTNVVVNCTNNSYTVGGSVTGLIGSVVLRDNAGDNLTVSANGAFTFATQVANGSPYSVTVLTQPTGQTCSVSAGAGTVSGGNVTNVVMICSANAYSVGGSVTGLIGSVVLQDNNGDNLSVSGNGTFSFATKVANGSTYSVTVLTQPTGQSCSVASGTGMIASANVTNVAITCAANSYTIGGTISGLVGSVVLQDNGGDNLTVTSNGSFQFATAVVYGNPYSVTVLTQPSGQTCVSSGSGTVSGNVTNVVVNCTSITATANITVQNLTVGTAMASFTPLTATGGATPYIYSYSGTLPAGLSFNASTGAVTGTPTATYAAANLVFSVKDANNVVANTTSTVSFTVVNQVSGATTALGSYIADQLNSSFTSAGWWSNGPTSATVPENTLTASGSPNVYNYTYKEITLTGGGWADSSIAPSYDLASTGWIPSLYTASEVDSGDGTTYFWTATGEPTVTVTVKKTDLTGTSLPNSTGVYPAGSTLYTSIQDIAQYYLWGLYPITDATGTALTALPKMGATFCDTDNVIVFQAIAVGSNNYNAYTTASCAATDISTALLTTPSDTALISIQPTGNSNVPNVILVTGLTTNSGLNDTIYGLQAGKVWAGNTDPAGYTWAEKNKTAINADLIDSGYISVP